MMQQLAKHELSDQSVNPGLPAAAAIYPLQRISSCSSDSAFDQSFSCVCRPCAATSVFVAGILVGDVAGTCLLPLA